MAVIVSDSSNPFYTSYLSDPSAFYLADSYNLGAYSATTLDIATQRNIDVTFTSNANCCGIILALHAVSAVTTARGVRVTLQENVGGTWTARAVKDMTCAEINPEYSMGGNSFVGFFVPFKFDNPYPIDTTAGKWRFNVAVSTAVGSTSIWQLMTSNGLAPAYVTWCDNPVTANDEDTLIVADKVIINRSITLRGLAATGETTTGTCAWICRSMDISKSGVCLLEWENPPAESYTLTLGGRIYMGSFSGFRVGSEEDRIPFNRQAIICRKTTPDYGTVVPGFLQYMGTTSARSRGKSAFFLYGEIPEQAYAVLAQNENANQPVIHLTEDVSGKWFPGDYVYVGKQYLRGQGTIVWQQISAVNGSTVTLTSNLLSYRRYAGGTVINRDRGYGIHVQGYMVFNIEHPNYFEVSGCKLEKMVFMLQVTTSYYNYPALPANRDKHVIENNIMYTDNTSVYYTFNGCLIPPEGMSFKRNVSFRQTMLFQPIAYYADTVATNKWYSGLLELNDNRICAQYAVSHLASTAGVYVKVHIKNNSFENSAYSFVYAGDIDLLMTNNVFWGNSASVTGGGSVRMSKINNGLSENNYFDYCACAIGFIGSETIINFRSNYDKFGTIAPNVNDLSFYGSLYYDVVFRYATGSNSGKLIIHETYIRDGANNSLLGIEAENNEPKVDKSYTPFGKFQRCGYELEDPTVHTSGEDKYSLRFEPFYPERPLLFSQVIPIGNHCMNKQLNVTAWLKINSANYYAGEHINPTIEVIYDLDSSTRVTASSTTAWQQLSLNFTPITPFNRMKLNIYGATSATTTNAYFYVDSVNVQLPQNTFINFGDMNIWQNGLPVTPFLSVTDASSTVAESEPKLLIIRRPFG